jgi:hypothetical protein
MNALYPRNTGNLQQLPASRNHPFFRANLALKNLRRFESGGNLRFPIWDIEAASRADKELNTSRNT